MLNKLHPLSRYKANSDKNKKKCLMHFDPVLGTLPLAIDTNTALQQIFFSNLYLFDSIFSIRNGLHDFDEEICFSDKCCYRDGQKIFFKRS